MSWCELVAAIEGLRESYGEKAEPGGSRGRMSAEDFEHLAYRMGPTKSIRTNGRGGA